MEDYRPPRLPKDLPTIVPTDSILPYGPCGIIFWLIRLGGLITWTYFVCRYGWDLSINSVINPVRHDINFTFFAFSHMAFVILTLLIEPAMLFRARSVRFSVFSFLLFVAWFMTMISWGMYHGQYHPYRCENMGGKFPVHVEFLAYRGKFKTGLGTNMASVYVGRNLLWQVSHDETNFGRLHTFISAEYLANGRNGLVRKRTAWPETAVSDIWTNFTRGVDESHATVSGTCNGQLCLKGKLWLYPNLRYRWTYTNPVTGEMRSKNIGSDEGQWFFGTRHRPLVSLKDGNGTEVFRAQSTRVVCSAGDGDYETSLVPVGLMLLAEKLYNGGTYGGDE